MLKGIDYQCAHCDEMLVCRAAKSQDFNADIIFEHLYYHGENLYRCSVCGFIHYKRSVIKKHLLREHQQQDGVVVVRESSVWWDCSLCDLRTRYRQTIMEHMMTKHNLPGERQELLSYVGADGNPKCAFQLLPLLRCFYCMGTTVGTYGQLLAHCKEEHTGKTFACVDFWNVFKCGFCPYLNGSGIQKEIQEHFIAIHSGAANTANSYDHMDNDFLAWALAFGSGQTSDGSVKKAEIVRYICNRCGTHTDSEESLGEHMAYHLFDFACPHCSCAFKELKVLYEHATLMHAQADINAPRTFNTVPHYEQLFGTLAMFSNGLILSKRELSTTVFLSYMRDINKGVQTSYARQLADLAQYKSDLQLPLETVSGNESEGETCASFVKKQYFYPALIISQMSTSDARYDNERHVHVKTEELDIPIKTERNETKRMRRSNRF
uniref:C2H2-type domain-containing protein n=1 Tax=Anopheles albimanus TaxID=7167 RepID=A0A182FTF7_ANOAL